MKKGPPVWVALLFIGLPRADHDHLSWKLSGQKIQYLSDSQYDN